MSNAVLCLACKQPIDGTPVAQHLKGVPVWLHAECWRVIEERHAERVAFAVGRTAPVLASLPAFSVSFASTEFEARVKSDRLRKFARSYVAEKHGSVAAIGATGCGKSTAMAAVVRRLCAEAVDEYTKSGGRSGTKLDDATRIYWVTAAALCIARKQHRLGEGEAPELARAEKAPLLALDELGQESAEPSWLLELLDVRYASGLPTLTTSGLTRIEIESRYGSGSTRRLVEPKGHFVDLFGEKGPA